MSFLSTLSVPDLTRLRQAVKRVHLRNGFPAHILDDKMCDHLIDVVGRDICQRMLEATHGDLLLIGGDGETINDLGDGLTDKEADIVRAAFEVPDAGA